MNENEEIDFVLDGDDEVVVIPESAFNDEEQDDCWF